MRRATPILFLALTAFAQTDRQPKPPASSDDFVRDLRGARASLPDGRTFALVSGSFLGSDAAGKTARFSAWIKTENVKDGYAGLWWNVQGPGKPDHRANLAFDNSRVRFIDGAADDHNGTIRGATGTTPWTHYELTIPISKSAAFIYFGALLTGSGAAWIDAMKIELDGQPYTPPQHDLDFESGTLKGFIVGCGGSAICTGYQYKTVIDNTVAYSGHQSLKMQYVHTEK